MEMEVERTEVEVAEVERIPMEDLVESTEESSGGKGKLIGLAVAGVTAVVVGAVMLFRKHKGSEAENQEAEEDFEDDEYFDEEIDEDFDQFAMSTEEVSEDVKDSEK